jgi:pimeloyl-ACP methyl ester carboxylesterase
VVVLLHGGGTDSALLSWRVMIPDLAAAGFRVLAPDWPGYGASPAPAQPFNQALLIGTLHALMDAWGLERAALAGVSMGGGAALGMALQYPERVERLTLIGAYGLQDRAPAHAFSTLYVRLPLVNELTWWTYRASRRVVRETLRTIIRNPASLTEELVDEVCAAVQSPDGLRTFAQWQRDEVRPGGLKTCYMPRLSEVRAPVLLIHGTHDIGVPVRFAREAAQRLPNARLMIVEGAGHWTQRDAPAEVNAAVAAFLGEGNSQLPAVSP